MGTINKLRLVLLALLVVRKGSDAARILGIFPIASRSHFVVDETLMRGLAARGHQVDIVSPFPLKSPPANYRDISIAGMLPTTVNNLTLDNAKEFTISGMKNGFVMAGTTLCDFLRLPQLQNIIKNPPTDPPYDLVITGVFSAECYLAFGRHLKVPVVGVVPSKLFDWLNEPLGNPHNSAFVPNVFSSFSQRMTFLERLQNTLQSFFLRVLYSHTVSSQQYHLKKYFGLELSNQNELYNDVALLLINTHPSFDFVRPLTSGIVEIGGIHVTDGDTDLPPEIKKWLDGSKDGCVYFSFGSMVKIESFPIETIKAFYGAFQSIAPVRVLIKIAKSDELPPGLPNNVMTYPWLPQTRVLQHRNVKAFITHCGLMSIQEAVTYGVPMIGVPIFSDQHVNLRLCERHNIIVPVDYQKITQDSFTKAISSVLKNSTYSENSKRLAKLFVDRPMTALDTATFWVEYVLRNGNVLRSPAADLTWWQCELLDVYAFLIAITLLTIYILKRLLGLIFSLLCLKFQRQENRQSSNAQSKSKKNK